MSPVKVKICGFTDPQQAAAVAQLGADYVGLNFYPQSPRYVQPDVAREIVEALPPSVTAVGIFVNAGAEEVDEIAESAGLGCIQLHGDEPATFCNTRSRPVIKAIRLDGQTDIAAFREYDVFAFLVDSVTSAYGGSGVLCDWGLARRAKGIGRLILAGGLHPGNVARAVEEVRPFGVDVASGVEVSPGRKDLKKVEAFIREAKGIS